MHRSPKIKKRLFECLENGEIPMGDEVEIIQVMVQRLNLSTISEYSRRHKISPSGAKKRVLNNKEASIKMNGQVFIVD